MLSWMNKLIEEEIKTNDNKKYYKLVIVWVLPTLIFFFKNIIKLIKKVLIKYIILSFINNI